MALGQVPPGAPVCGEQEYAATVTPPPALPLPGPHSHCSSLALPALALAPSGYLPHCIFLPLQFSALGQELEVLGQRRWGEGPLLSYTSRAPSRAA